MHFRCENRVPDGLKMLFDHIESLFDGLRLSRWSLVLGQQDILLRQEDILLGQENILPLNLIKAEYNNNNNNNNGVSGGRGLSEKILSNYSVFVLAGTKKRIPKHKCCGNARE